jgi:hypothetical protein
MVTAADIKSERYERFIGQSWSIRHSNKHREKWGAWRWRGMFEHRKGLLKILDKDYELPFIDFGGAKAGVFIGTTIIDKGDELPDKIAGVFTSHTLEHLEDPEEQVADFYDRMDDGAYIIAHLPSVYGSQHWHPDTYKHKDDPHHWVFIVGGHEDSATILDTRVMPAQLLFRAFEIDEMDYCGDRSLMVIARKA